MKALLFFGLGFVSGIIALVGIVYFVGKAELKRLNKWE